MATRKPPPQPQQANMTLDQMRKGVTRLERLIEQIQSFNVETITKRWSPEQKALETTIEATLTSVFGHNTVEYRRYSRSMALDQGGVVMDLGFGSRGDDGGRLARQYVSEGKEQAVQTLRAAVSWLREEIEHSDESPVEVEEALLPNNLSRKIFLVHGHDEAALQSVARFVDRIGFTAIILSEQANQGMTIIEKIEAQGDVGFAIVLLTPDDVGGKSPDVLRPRARQNVLLELGYFIARLRRERVFTLARGDLEIPTDFAGMVWQPLDNLGAWKQALARELHATGYAIDWNKVMA